MPNPIDRTLSHPAATALLGFAATALLGFAATSASAQAYYRGGYPGYGYGGGYHASTAAEGYARGMAEAVRAQGEKNLNDSRAAINREDARSKYLDNRVKAAETYWERRKVYDKEMAEQRYQEGQRRLDQRNRVMLKELSPDQFNLTTGAVAWPGLLKDPSYNDFRKPLDELFAKRAQYGALTSDEYLQAKELVRTWRGAVTARKASYPEAALRNALRFLLKLNRELDNNLG